MTKTLTPSKNEIAQEALQRAQANNSVANYGAIYHGFMARGIKMEDITPRVNVLTYHAWLAKGRQVRKGEKGVKVDTWVPIFKKDEVTGENKKVGQRPKTTTVFHLTQTDPV